MASLALVLALSWIIPLEVFSLEIAAATTSPTLDPEDIEFPPRDPTSQSVTEYCQAFQSSVVSGNLLSWSVPSECAPFVQAYFTGRQYQADLNSAMSLALQKAQTFCPRPGIDAWIFDVDGTLLSTTPYYATKQFGSGSYNDTDFNLWAARGVAPPILPVRSFYQTLLRTNWTVFLISTRPESLRRVTVRNLRAAGYSEWKWLFMRQPLFSVQDKGVVQIKQANKLSRTKALENVGKAGFKPQGVTSNQQSNLQDDTGEKSYVPDVTGNN